ncbi:Hpt domain-containing protein [Roseivivax lentus]|uniref:Hpt domain-containing protein n=1 Tax=Roseivivax lentus TaxID=633194 RepID=A0A1N7P6G7_9RHOB|nr:Hpt domain-containing protein [Roseivivax lentus]SIT06171.1 Hpt domain-containing protein [Roseivivax lentus]
MQAIRQRFLDGLEERLAEMESLVDLLDDPNSASRVWAEIRMRVHRIAGVAGSLGFAALGARAAQIDNAIEAMPQQGAPLKDATLRAAMDSLLDDIDEILEIESAA